MNLREIPREFRELPIALIDEPELPSRSEMDEQKMEELVTSIRDIGLIQPISVAKNAERYEVVAGHRRRLASARAGLVSMPCVVYPSKDIALEAVKTAENADREDINAADEAFYFHQLLETSCGGDVDRLCDVVRRKRSYVEGRLLLFSGDEGVFRSLQRGDINIGIAHELNKCSDQAHRRMFLDQAIRGGATVAIVRGWVEEWKRYSIHVGAPAATATDAATPPPIPESNFYMCPCCGRSDAVHQMRYLNVHPHCEQAILRPALELFANRGATLRFPRTLDEAVATINEVTRAFPELAGE